MYIYCYITIQEHFIIYNIKMKETYSEVFTFKDGMCLFLFHFIIYLFTFILRAFVIDSLLTISVSAENLKDFVRYMVINY